MEVNTRMLHGFTFSSWFPSWSIVLWNIKRISSTSGAFPGGSDTSTPHYSLSCICSTNILLGFLQTKKPFSHALSHRLSCSLPSGIAGLEGGARPAPPGRSVLGIQMVRNVKNEMFWWLQGLYRVGRHGKAWTLGLLIPRNLLLSIALSSVYWCLESDRWDCKGIK